MTKKVLLATAAIAAGLAMSGAASANTVTYDFTGSFNGGTIDGVFSLDVSGGLATSGWTTISGPGISGVQKLYVVEPIGATYEATGGTELYGADNLFPLTGNGINFGSNAPGSLSNGYDFGIWDNGGGSYQGFAGGPNGLWAYTGGLTLTSTGTPTVASVPEPAIWTMLGLGFGALGFAGYRRARTSRAVSL